MKLFKKKPKVQVEKKATTDELFNEIIRPPEKSNFLFVAVDFFIELFLSIVSPIMNRIAGAVLSIYDIRHPLLEKVNSRSSTLLGLIITSFIAFVMMFFVLVSEIMNPKVAALYGLNNEKDLVVQIPTRDLPNLNYDKMINFVTKVLEDMYNVNFRNVDDVVQSLKKYFSPEGWDQFYATYQATVMQSVKRYGYISSISVTRGPTQLGVENRIDLHKIGVFMAEAQIVFIGSTSRQRITQLYKYGMKVEYDENPTPENPLGFRIITFLAYKA